MSYISKENLLKEYNSKCELLAKTPLHSVEYKSLKTRIEEIDFSLELIAEAGSPEIEIDFQD